MIVPIQHFLLLLAFALLPSTGADHKKDAKMGAKKIKGARKYWKPASPKGPKPTSGPLTPYIAVLNSAQSNCLNSTALGNALVTEQNGILCVYLSYGGLSGPETESHIHRPAAIGANAGVVFVLPGGNVKQACFALDKPKLDWLEDNLLYTNIHSAQCPEGEIRGQILKIS